MSVDPVNYRWGSTGRGRREKALMIGEVSSGKAQRDFAKRFERGELRSRRPDRTYRQFPIIMRSLEAESTCG